MAIFPMPPGGGVAIGSVGAAGRASGLPTYPGIGHAGSWDNDGSIPSDSQGGVRTTISKDGFTFQGKPYDPILDEPMVVSAETHGDYWEDDMDYSESVTYDGVMTVAGVASREN